MLRIFGQTEKLAAFQEGFCFMESLRQPVGYLVGLLDGWSFGRSVSQLVYHSDLSMQLLISSLLHI